MKRKHYEVRLNDGKPAIRFAFNAGDAAGAKMIHDHGMANDLQGTWIRIGAEIHKHEGTAIAGVRRWQHNGKWDKATVTIRLNLEQVLADYPGALDNPAIACYYPEVPMPPGYKRVAP